LRSRSTAHPALALTGDRFADAGGRVQGEQFAVLAGVGELVGDRAVVDLDAVVGPAEEAAAVADLEQVDDDVDRDEQNSDDREPRERDVVFEREDRARLAAGSERSDTRSRLWDVLICVV
jgi:hypothetical protein